MSQRFFSGRESWVFRARTVEELCGYHPDLVAGALCPAERIEYLVYSPLREADGGPFGIVGGSGSHALAVTNNRILVSRDPHCPGISRTIRSVAFTDMLAVEVGEALTLGWFVVRFACEGRVESETVFFQSSGIELFRTVMRLCRRRGAASATLRAQTETWDHLLAPSPSYLRNQIVPVLNEYEEPRRVFHSAEGWTVSGRSAKCVIPSSVHAITDGGVVSAESERPNQLGMLVFAVRVVSIAREVIQGARFISREQSDARIVTVGVDSEAHGSHHQTLAILDEHAAAEFVQVIATLRP